MIIRWRGIRAGKPHWDFCGPRSEICGVIVVIVQWVARPTVPGTSQLGVIDKSDMDGRTRNGADSEL